MDEVLAVVLILLFGLVCYGMFLMGDGDSSLKSSSSTYMQHVVEEQKSTY